MDIQKRSLWQRNATPAAAFLALAGAGYGGNSIVARLDAIAISCAKTAQEVENINKVSIDHELRLRSLEANPVTHGSLIKQHGEAISDHENRIRKLESKR